MKMQKKVTNLQLLSCSSYLPKLYNKTASATNKKLLNTNLLGKNGILVKLRFDLKQMTKL